MSLGKPGHPTLTTTLSPEIKQCGHCGQTPLLSPLLSLARGPGLQLKVEGRESYFKSYKD